MVETFFWLSFAIFVYFVFYAVTTFGLICRSLYETVLAGLERGRLFAAPERLRRPGISLIAPAYNMAPLIAASARALLAADYDPLEVVIVDDGSDDGTTAALDAAFDLVELPVGDRMKIPTRTVVGYYVSRSDPRLRVLQKENGGRSDADRDCGGGGNASAPAESLVDTGEMMTQLTANDTLEELDYRESNGISVSLRWNRRSNQLSVVVEDNRCGLAFTLDARPDNALDIFHHPYAYTPPPLAA